MHWIVGCVGPRVGLEALKNKKSVACDKVAVHWARYFPDAVCYVWMLLALQHWCFTCVPPPPYPIIPFKSTRLRLWVMAGTHYGAHSCNFPAVYRHWRFKLSGKWWSVAAWVVPTVLKDSMSSATPLREPQILHCVHLYVHSVYLCQKYCRSSPDTWSCSQMGAWWMCQYTVLVL
jgi:hypothetical protein